MDDPFVWVRAVHFAATILVSGTAVFGAVIAEPAFRKAAGGGSIAVELRSRLVRLAAIGLALAVLSGAAWLFYVAARMADLPLAQTLTDRAVWTVLTDTDFGHVWIGRLVLAGLLAMALHVAPGARYLAVLLAVALVGALAWSGHAAAGEGLRGAVHLVSDMLHLVAAASWLGALVPLALTLAVSVRSTDRSATVIAREIVPRFSSLGLISVGTLLATGIVNSWMLVGSTAALFETGYGRLLLLKISLFIGMLAFAAVNRLILTPRLLQASTETALRSAHRIGTNSLIEATLGAAILVVVGALGIMQPGAEG